VAARGAHDPQTRPNCALPACDAGEEDAGSPRSS
jgi:hypothetical protein